MIVVHSAPHILSAIGVYSGNKLVAVSHLISADCLPDKDMIGNAMVDLSQLLFDATTIQQPHLSAPDERAMIVFGHTGDFAIVKGKWEGYKRMVPPNKDSKTLGVAGNAGKLSVGA